MNIKKSLGVVSLGVLLMGFGCEVGLSSDPGDTSSIQFGQQTIRDRLGDPRAQFRNLVAYNTTNRAHVVCGEVASEKVFGKQAEVRRFIVSAGLGIIENKAAASAMESLWQQTCVR